MSTTVLRVLVLEDNPGDARLIREMFADAGGAFEVRVVDRMERAARALKDLDYDVLLSDLGLPDSQGLDTVKQARTLSPTIPIVVLTGTRDDSLAVEALRVGADDYLPKGGFDPHTLVRSVRYAVERRKVIVLAERSAREAQAAEAALRTQAGMLRELTEAGVRIATALSLEDMVQVVANTARQLFNADTAFVGVSASPAQPTVTAISAAGERSQEESSRVVASGLALHDAIITGWGAESRGDKTAEGSTPEVIAPSLWITAPIGEGEGQRPRGSICLFGNSTEAFGEHDASALHLLAQLADRAVRNVQMIEEIRAAVRAREEVLAIVSHDLINPLAATYMSATWLLETPDVGVETQRKQLALIQRSAIGMDRLIRDLLDISRIEAGGLAVETRPEEATVLIEEAVELLEPLAAAKGVRLRTDVESNLPPVKAERDRILQVLSNLIGNAIKFTPGQGQVEVRVVSDGNDLQFAVADEGPGIRSEDHARLFDRFWQVRRSQRAGVGLGLAIAKGVVEAHGGMIWVESVEGEGSTFFFRLPIAATPVPS